MEETWCEVGGTEHFYCQLRLKIILKVMGAIMCFQKEESCVTGVFQINPYLRNGPKRKSCLSSRDRRAGKSCFTIMTDWAHLHNQVNTVWECSLHRGRLSSFQCRGRLPAWLCPQVEPVSYSCGLWGLWPKLPGQTPPILAPCACLCWIPLYYW